MVKHIEAQPKIQYAYKKKSCVLATLKEETFAIFVPAKYLLSINRESLFLNKLA